MFISPPTATAVTEFEGMAAGKTGPRPREADQALEQKEERRAVGKTDRQERESVCEPNPNTRKERTHTQTNGPVKHEGIISFYFSISTSLTDRPFYSLAQCQYGIKVESRTPVSQRLPGLQQRPSQANPWSWAVQPIFTAMLRKPFRNLHKRFENKG